MDDNINTYHVTPVFLVPLHGSRALILLLHECKLTHPSRQDILEAAPSHELIDQTLSLTLSSVPEQTHHVWVANASQ